MTRSIRHYSNVVRLPSIVTDGCLRPVNAENPGARPLLWFTEGTADPRGTQASSAHKLLAPVIQGAIEHHGTLSFIVPPSDRRLQRWVTNWERFGVTPEAFGSLTRLADDYGLDQAEFLVSTESIELEALAVEIRIGGRWVPVTMMQALHHAGEVLRELSRLAVAAHFL